MLRVRDALPRDIRAIAEINVRGWQAAFRGLFPDEYLDASDPSNREAVVSEILSRRPRHHVAVATEDEQVVGYMMLGPPRADDLDPDRVHELLALYIEPDRIGTGLGRILMDYALNLLHTGGWDDAVLWTLRDAERTCRFYETAGWSRDGAERIEEIPSGNPVVLVRYRIHLR